MTGRVIAGAYRITGFQRAGRMGDIFMARRLENNEVVSIKLMDPSLFGETEAIRRFERETRITKKLHHPCSLVVRDVGRTEDGLPYMVTEYVEGDLLSDVLEESGKLPPERAGYIAAQIAMALDAAHRIGVIHRDLAPTNILITAAQGQADSVKVIEFGLSRLQEGDGGETGEGSTLTAVGVRIGTPFYMAPEYIEEYALDHRADLYSLGIVLFEMLTGSPPFTGRPYKVMDLHLTQVPPPPSSVAPDVPEWLDTLVAHLLEKDPANRPQSAAEVVKRLEEGLGERLQTVQTAEQAETEPDPRPVAAGATVAPWIERYIDAQVQSVKEGGPGPDPAEALIAYRVAAQSIAARIGVKPGWLCSLPDEPSSGMRDPGLWSKRVAERRYLFADPEGTRKVELRCSGADIGVEFVRSGRHIRAHLDVAHADAGALLELWLQGDWDALHKLTGRVLARQRGAAGVLNTGLFARFLGSAKPTEEPIRFREHPALALHGAALVEEGRVNDGMALLREYARDHAHGFPARYTCVSLFYEGMERERSGDTDRAVDLYAQSWLAYANRRASDRIRHLTGKIPDNRAWYGRQFPDYTLDAVKKRGHTVNLYSVLAGLQGHQVQLVVLMGGTRANAEYNQFMARYHAFADHFDEFLRGVHVVTDTVERDPAHAAWTAAEDEAVAARRPIQVLEDYRGFLQRAIKPPTAPTVYGVSRTGLVVHEGQLGSVDLWDMLADLGRLYGR